METALVIGPLCVGAVAGGMIVVAWFSDYTPPVRNIHSGSDNLERRARRVQ